MISDLGVEIIDSSCCGMGRAFGYEADHYHVSMRMAEADLLPGLRRAASGTTLVATGTSCRHQIEDGAGRRAEHQAVTLAHALDAASTRARAPAR